MKKLVASIIIIFSLHYSGYCTIIKDTIPGFKVKSYQFNYDYTTLDSIAIDTLLRGFQNYNPAFQNLAFNNFLGNLSSPYQSVLYGDRIPFEDFLFGQSTEYITQQPNGTFYYNARHPYTVLTYYANFPSMQEEQKMRIVHTQNVNRYFNLGASFDLVNSLGNYTYQQNISDAITLFSSYHGQRYSIYGNINWNTIKVTENGGLVKDSNYVHSNGTLNEIPFNLNSASSLLKQQSIFVFQRFYITGSYKVDSLRNSSKWNEAVSLIHRLTYNQTTRSYTDYLINGDSTYYYNNQFKFNKYKAFGFNQDTTLDSVYLMRFENIFQFAVNAYQWLKIPAEIRIGIKNQLDKINTYSFDSASTINPGQKYFTNTSGYKSLIINNALIGELTDRFSKTISWGASGEFYFTGYKQGDVLLSGDIRKSIKHNFIMNLSGSLTNMKPGYFLNSYVSNNFYWPSNNFHLQQSSSIKLGLYHLKRKLYIDARWDNLINYVYFNSNAVPEQAPKAFLVYSVTVAKMIDWGAFHSNIKLTYQTSGNEEAISIPQFSGFTSTYLAFNLFNKNLMLQFGLDVFYNSKYYANSYSPVTSIFYAQQQKLIDNDPYANVFLNFKIKRTRFFFKYEHIDGYLPNNYGYFIPHYPIDPPLLKFGISWTFYD